MCQAEGEKLLVMGARGSVMGKPGARPEQGMGGCTLPGRGTEPKSLLEEGVSSLAVRVLCFAHCWWQTPHFPWGNPVGCLGTQRRWLQRWITAPQGGCPSSRIHGTGAAGLRAASPNSALSHRWYKRKQSPRALR